jgi:hypothetical protein
LIDFTDRLRVEIRYRLRIFKKQKNGARRRQALPAATSSNPGFAEPGSAENRGIHAGSSENFGILANQTHLCFDHV